MKLLDFLNLECISAHLNASSKIDLLDEISELIANCNPKLNKTSILTHLKERESIGSTGIGEGVAIPHCKYSGLKNLVAAFGLSKEGIDFDAIDGKKVHFICLIIAPENSIGLHLKALARISRIFKKEELRNKLIETNTSKEIYSVFKEIDA